MRRIGLILILICFWYLNVNAQTNFPWIFSYSLNDGATNLYKDLKEDRYILYGYGSNNMTGEFLTAIVYFNENGEKIWDSVFNAKSAAPLLLDEIKQFSEFPTNYYCLGEGSDLPFPRIMLVNDSLGLKVTQDEMYNLANGQAGFLRALYLNSNKTEFIGMGQLNVWPNQRCILFYKVDKDCHNTSTKFICSDSMDLFYKYSVQVKDSDLFDVFIYDEHKTGKLWMIRIDGNGEIISKKIVHHHNMSDLIDITKASNGNYLVVTNESYTTFGTFGRNIGLLLSENGDSITSVDLSKDTVQCILINSCPTGGFTISGATDFTRLDDALKIKWQKRLNNNWLSLTRAVETSHQGFIIAGEITYQDSSQDSQNYSDWIVYKIDSSGNITGIDEIFPIPQNQQITIYPNPVNDIINFNTQLSKEFLGSYFIYDYKGEIIQMGEMGLSQKLNVQNLPVGLYLLQLANSRQALFKFIKQ